MKILLLLTFISRVSSLTYKIVDTGQSKCYDATEELSTCPSASDAFYGQDANYNGAQASYTNNRDGTITDLNTGLMWKKAYLKLGYTQAVNRASKIRTGGYTDWRLPTITELYSLALFSGVGCSGCSSVTSKMQPFLDGDYFNFAYGDTSAGERVIDAQYLSSTDYVGTTMNNDDSVFGFNFADGRIKGYQKAKGGEDTTFFARYVRDNTNSDYGKNTFVDNSDGTISDSATGLMWAQDDSGSTGMNWQAALAYAEASSLAGHNDWRLPNAKELHSIVDYRQSPQTTNFAAIDPQYFTASQITREDGEMGYGWYWTSTTLIDGNSATGIYICFGECLGEMNEQIVDVHGAGAQRSDPTRGLAGTPASNGIMPSGWD